jgi:hypothetical protein
MLAYHPGASSRDVYIEHTAHKMDGSQSTGHSFSQCKCQHRAVHTLAVQFESPGNLVLGFTMHGYMLHAIRVRVEVIDAVESDKPQYLGLWCRHLLHTRQVGRLLASDYTLTRLLPSCSTLPQNFISDLAWPCRSMSHFQASTSPNRRLLPRVTEVAPNFLPPKFKFFEKDENQNQNQNRPEPTHLRAQHTSDRFPCR